MLCLAAGVDRVPEYRWQLAALALGDVAQLGQQLLLRRVVCKALPATVQRAQQLTLVAQTAAPGHDLAQHTVAFGNALLQWFALMHIDQQIEQADAFGGDVVEPVTALCEPVLTELVGIKRDELLLEHACDAAQIIVHLLLGIGRTLATDTERGDGQQNKQYGR